MSLNLRQSIVRAYRGVGIVVLVAVLVGLFAYLTVNIYYFVSRSWVRPVVLSAHDPRVVTASRAQSESEEAVLQLASRLGELDIELSELTKRTEMAQAFVAESEAALAKATVFEKAMITSSLQEARLTIATSEQKKLFMEADKDATRRRLELQRDIAKQLGGSPFLLAAKKDVAVVFVPYKNVSNAKVGTKLYRCKLGLVWCNEVGRLLAVLPGEVTGSDPNNDKDERGVYAEVSLSPAGSRERVLFLDGGPLSLF